MIYENQLLASVILDQSNRTKIVDLEAIVPIGTIETDGGCTAVSLSHDGENYDLVAAGDAGDRTARYIKLELTDGACAKVSICAGAGYIASRCDYWTDCFRQYDDWSGGDGIYTFNITNGRDTYNQMLDVRTLFFFGDTMVSKVDRDTLARVGPVYMPNNTFAVLDGEDPQKPGALTFHVKTGENGTPVAAIRPSRDCYDFDIMGEDFDKAYFWLQDGAVIDGKLYVMPSIITENPSGPVGFQFRGLGVVIAEVAIKDGLPDFDHAVQHKTGLWLKEESVNILYGACILPFLKEAGYEDGDGYVYIYGQHTAAESGRHCLCVARVRPEAFTDDSQWRFYDGTGFVEGIRHSVPILDHISCEMSVMPIVQGKNKGKFLAVFQYDTKSSYTAYAIGETVCGPFSEPQKVFFCDEDKLDSSVYMYNAKAHTHLSYPDKIVVSYNVNTTSYDLHLKNGHVYRPRFIVLEDTTIPLTGRQR